MLILTHPVQISELNFRHQLLATMTAELCAICAAFQKQQFLHNAEATVANFAES